MKESVELLPGGSSTFMSPKRAMQPVTTRDEFEFAEILMEPPFTSVKFPTKKAQ